MNKGKKWGAFINQEEPKTELLFIQYRASCTQKTQIPLHSFPIQPDTKTSHGQLLLFILRPYINKKSKGKMEDAAAAASSAVVVEEERLDVLNKTGQKTGISKPRGEVHRDGDYHRAVHVWIYSESTQELLLQRRADCKDSWPGRWDISSAGHISAGDSSLVSAQRELQEELGISLPKDAFEHIFIYLQEWYTENTVARSLSLQKQLCRYAPVSLDAELTGLSNTDRKTLGLLIKAAKLMDEIFYLQVWYSNPALRDWLKEHASASELDKLKWMYYLINKSPWSCLDENEAFLTTTDSAIKLLPEATKPVSGWKGLDYKAAFPMLKPPGANFYPPDMDKKEFKLWNDSLTEKEQNDAMGFFTVIKTHSEFSLDSSLPNHAVHGTNHLMTAHDLYSVPYSKEYNSFLRKAAELLHEAGDLAGSPSLKRLLHSKADAFLSNDYYESDIAWMELVSMQNTLTFQKTLMVFGSGIW
ncbi:nudix hydrolase 3-like isoform X2 [Populus nigra]|uniref:nudix hydrolase 3-like isoform X2 n=1 Tax=Populus nigra TaxID=3691 RepID=UPI002B26B3C2|nr:nudix hydrolase 3-like isoform X2 [Populus nigra]